MELRFSLCGPKLHRVSSSWSALMLISNSTAHPLVLPQSGVPQSHFLPIMRATGSSMGGCTSYVNTHTWEMWLLTFTLQEESSTQIKVYHSPPTRATSLQTATPSTWEIATKWIRGPARSKWRRSECGLWRDLTMTFPFGDIAKSKANSSATPSLHSMSEWLRHLMMNWT